MNLDHLRYFIETARLSHLGKAAANLRITVSTISHAIAQLEAELGVALFDRAGRGIITTPAGNRMRERAEEIINLVAATRAELASPEINNCEHLRVAATHGLLQRVLATELGGHAMQYRGFTFELASRRSSEGVEAVALGEVEAALVFSPQESPRIERQVLAEVPLVVACHKQHPLAQSFAKISDVNEQAFYSTLKTLPFHAIRSYPGIDNCERHPTLIAHGVAPKPVAISDSYDGVLAAVASSNAWAIVPSVVATEHDQVLGIFPNWEARVNISMVWRTGKPPSKLLERIMLKALNHIK